MSHLIEVEHLKKYFKTPGGMLHAVDDVSFTIKEGTTLGVVGESGCGKSTMGRAIIGLHEATSGHVRFQGKDITSVSRRARKNLYKEMQLVFQDPYSSLNPRMCVTELIEEPLRVLHLCKNKEERQKKVAELMETVGLSERLRLAYPHELDGGRRQRVGIARALAVEPSFIVCDEPVSALDVSIQAQILNLLQDLQESKNLTYIFITHDLSVVKHISDEIAVMYLGTIVERCKANELFVNPIHPYTQGLLSAIPSPDIDVVSQRIVMKGEIGSPVDPPPGCRFADRCPHAQPICRTKNPSLREVAENHLVACHVFAAGEQQEENA